MNPIHKPNQRQVQEPEWSSDRSATTTKAERANSRDTYSASINSQSAQTIDTRKGFAVDRNGQLNNYPITPEVYLQKEPRFGFTRFAEVWNGRLAMIGFTVSVLTELATGKSFLAYWFGIS